MSSPTNVVTIEEQGPLLLIGINRPVAHNLWNLDRDEIRRAIVDFICSHPTP